MNEFFMPVSLLFLHFSPLFTRPCSAKGHISCFSQLWPGSSGCRHVAGQWSRYIVLSGFSRFLHHGQPPYAKSHAFENASISKGFCVIEIKLNKVKWDVKRTRKQCYKYLPRGLCTSNIWLKPVSKNANKAFSTVSQRYDRFLKQISFNASKINRANLVGEKIVQGQTSRFQLLQSHQ